MLVITVLAALRLNNGFIRFPNSIFGAGATVNPTRRCRSHKSLTPTSQPSPPSIRSTTMLRFGTFLFGLRVLEVAAETVFGTLGDCALKVVPCVDVVGVRCNPSQINCCGTSFTNGTSCPYGQTYKGACCPPGGVCASDSQGLPVCILQTLTIRYTPPTATTTIASSSASTGTSTSAPTETSTDNGKS